VLDTYKIRSGTYPGRRFGGAAHLLSAPHLQGIVLLTPVVGVEKLKKSNCFIQSIVLLTPVVGIEKSKI
jgi:hypothetical protein